MDDRRPRTFNFADIWEAVAPQVEDRTALVCGEQRRTYGELIRRINRLARHLQVSGLGPGDRIGIFLRNGTEYIETMLAAFTIRAVPVNVNYRYVADELHHLLTDSEASGLVYHRTLEPAVGGVLGRLPTMRALLVVDDGLGPDQAQGSAPVDARDFEAALAAESDHRLDVPGRTGADHYLMYTGGTTGLPKGVLWRQEDAFFGCIGGGDPMRLKGPVSEPTEIPERIVDGFSFLPVAPLMHAAAQWTTLSWLFAGGKTTLMAGALDPAAVWQAVQDEAVNSLTVVGDAVGRPLVAAWEAEPDRWDTSSLFSISNGGAPMSPTLKARLAQLFPGQVITDGFGSSEAGVQGAQRLEAGGSGNGLARFTAAPGTEVFDDDLRPVDPGSGVVGRVANTGRLPIGYLNDLAKTAATFVEIDGRRYCFTGDMATVEPDGTIQLMGRGSGCINTGGEKVFPEEVEAALVAHPAVLDVLVVGVPDERWGHAVVAVVQPVAGLAAPTLQDLKSHLSGTLARYKLPKHLVLVDEVIRSPAGKADYRWAKRTATSSLGLADTSI